MSLQQQHEDSRKLTRYKIMVDDLSQENDELERKIETLESQIKLKIDRIAELESILRETVELYGKPGGPWNIPSDQGGWIEKARKVLEKDHE